MNFVGPATRLADIDLPRLGALIGVGEDELHAFLDVETSGSGFDDQKRPRILYEYHVFYRNLPAVDRDAAVQQGLATKSQGVLPYGKSSDQYPRLLRAMAINETAALKACSWGIGQVLGENFVAAGFGTVQAMVAAMVQSEADQLQAAVDFIRANRLDDELRAHQWAAFARGYNGANYAKFSYDTKLAAAFEKWSKIRDTPYPKPLSASLGEALRTPGVVKTSTLSPVPSAPPVQPVTAPPHVLPSSPKPGFWSSFWAALTGKKAA